MYADLSMCEGEMNISHGYVHMIFNHFGFVTTRIIYAISKHLPGKQGLVADPNDDFNCENPEKTQTDFYSKVKMKFECYLIGTM